MDKENLKIAVCTRYSTLGASSRLRFYLYRDLLESNGVHTQFYPLLGDSYLKRLYSGKRCAVQGVGALIKRMAEFPFMPENMLIEYELLPFAGVEFEEYLLRKRKYILSFDDAVWEKYRGNRRLQGKFERLAAKASGVIVANNAIGEYLSAFNRRMIKIPTAIDLNKYSGKEVEKRNTFTVGWIGTPVTYRECLLPFADMLRKASEKLDVEFLIIADSTLEPIPGVRMKIVDWHDEDEVMLLKKCHAGMMPLPGSDFMRGKSAYKLIQYLGCGLPCIASPVGENSVLMSRGKVGFCCENTAEWLKAFATLAEDAFLRDEMGKAALALAEEYSIQKYAPVFAGFIRECF